MAYNYENTHQTINRILVVLMLIVNSVFILKWAYMMVITLSSKYSFFKKLREFCAKIFSSDNEKREIRTPENKLQVTKKLVKGKQKKACPRKKRRKKATLNRRRLRKINKTDRELRKEILDSYRMEDPSTSNRAQMAMVSSGRMIDDFSTKRPIKESDNASDRIFHDRDKFRFSKIDHIFSLKRNKQQILEVEEEKTERLHRDILSQDDNSDLS